MSNVIGLGDDNDLQDWFLPEDKRAELPLEENTGMLQKCNRILVLGS